MSDVLQLLRDIESRLDLALAGHGPFYDSSEMIRTRLRTAIATLEAHAAEVRELKHEIANLQQTVTSLKSIIDIRSAKQ